MLSSTPAVAVPSNTRGIEAAREPTKQTFQPSRGGKPAQMRSAQGPEGLGKAADLPLLNTQTRQAAFLGAPTRQGPDTILLSSLLGLVLSWGLSMSHPTPIPTSCLPGDLPLQKLVHFPVFLCLCVPFAVLVH